VRTPLTSKGTRLRGIVAIVAGVLAAGGLATYAGTAGAAPQPSLTQVEQKINEYTSQYDQANQQYDQAVQQLSQARVKLASVNKQVAADEVQFRKLRGDVAQIAATSYENSNMTSVAGLLTSNDPQAVLNGASLLLELSGSRNEQMQAFLAATRQLRDAQQQAQRTRDALTAIEKNKEKNKNHASHMLAQEEAVKASLTSTQRNEVAAAGLGGTGATTAAAFTGTTATQGGKAAAFAVEMAQAACPYLYGGTGPCKQGYDCSGLAQAAWATAGGSIPRTTYEDWSSLPHISMSSLEPGDLILYDGEGHVAVYVGNGMIVDAPHSGANVEEISMNESWYAANADGAVRP
jgi:peptidoglycan DL-endopeptidase CwlO